MTSALGDLLAENASASTFLKNGGHRRQRMKDPGLRLVPETPIDGSGNACIVPDEGGLDRLWACPGARFVSRSR